MVRRPPKSPPFPTRRSSDLMCRRYPDGREFSWYSTRGNGFRIDRKSTRLNSSHVEISYAVFCLKKKTNCGLVRDDTPAAIALAPQTTSSPCQKPAVTSYGIL